MYDSVNVVRVSVFVLTTACGVVSEHDCRKLPADDASHSETYAIVSVVVIVHAARVEIVMLPPDAAFQVAWFRVGTADALFAPAAPGSPTFVCNLTKTVASAANAVFR